MHYLLWLGISAITFAIGEYTSKRYIMTPTWVWLITTYIAYNIGVATWFPALSSKNELAVVGTLWSLMSLIATVMIGVVGFNEQITATQTTGLLLAFAAILLLST